MIFIIISPAISIHINYNLYTYRQRQTVDVISQHGFSKINMNVSRRMKLRALSHATFVYLIVFFSFIFFRKRNSSIFFLVCANLLENKVLFTVFCNAFAQYHHLPNHLHSTQFSRTVLFSQLMRKNTLWIYILSFQVYAQFLKWYSLTLYMNRNQFLTPVKQKLWL